MPRETNANKKTRQSGKKRSSQFLQSLRDRKKSTSKPLEDVIEEIRRENKRNLKRRKQQIINHARRTNR